VIRRAITAGGLIAVLGLVVLTPGPAARTDCTQSGAQADLEIARGKTVTLRVESDGRITADGEQCGGATIATIDAIAVTGRGGSQGLELDLRGRSFEDVDLDVALGPGHDKVLLRGRRRAERHALGDDALTLDPTRGGTVELRAVNRFSATLGRGDDHLDAGPWRRALTLSGGPGSDHLRGGRRGNRILGGPDGDRLTGGPGGDRLDGGGGDDRCVGGPGTDALLSCAPPFDATATKLGRELRRRMTGKSWHRGCPVGLGKLRLLRVPHWTMGDRDVHNGRLVVHRAFDTDVLRAMRSLLRARFPIRRMELIDRYGGDDHRSMNADNTSAFNCRFVAGTTRWSEHAFGRAIDINPIENPYVSGSHVSPPAGRRYADRSRHASGMIHHGDAAYRAFRRVGWQWGGDWRGTKDYQHFSATGR
jgi:D-alanyl-D-alanine carboxypeptidase/RTX calcium-binding nonapeptide repeat (4 copies)